MIQHRYLERIVCNRSTQQEDLQSIQQEIATTIISHVLQESAHWFQHLLAPYTSDRVHLLYISLGTQESVAISDC
jgi:hypothetical protein